jgi:hypothetical protein
MAVLHNAELRPAKLELLAAWLPSRPWYPGGFPTEPALQRVAAGRFDDPDGEVGIETMLVRVGDGPLLHVPLTYRAAPLDGAEQWLIGTMDHSVLGKRWAYDGCGDPVYLQVLATTVLTGGTEAEEFMDNDGSLQQRPASISLRGTGTPGSPVPAIGRILSTADGDPAVVRTEAYELEVLRVPHDGASEGTELLAAWAGGSPVAIAYVRTR